jgi:hypothetical protein
VPESSESFPNAEVDTRMEQLMADPIVERASHDPRINATTANLLSVQGLLMVTVLNPSEALAKQLHEAILMVKIAQLDICLDYGLNLPAGVAAHELCLQRQLEERGLPNTLA